MKPHDKFLQQQQENLSASEQLAASQGAQEFSDSDEVLRFDAAQAIVPPEIAQRLQKSLGRAPAQGSWWKKFLGL